MKPERWQQLEQLFHSALERALAERAAFLDEACAGDDSLRKQVEALLSAHGEAGSFIENPAFEVEARLLANDQNESVVGQTIGHYKILSSLGVGGMGEVYLAQDMQLGRRVALKLLPAEFTRDIERVRRFQQEARAASALNHPNIITIHEIGQADERHFIATEFIDGEVLRRRISSTQSAVDGDKNHIADAGIQLGEVLSIGMQVADALAAAHAKGIVHRDIKPENIILVRDSHLMQQGSVVKVLDFGIAKLTELQTTGGGAEATTKVLLNTHEGSVIGTASYMSPEQARGEKVDARTDIWSLGIVLYEMLTRSVPFGGDTAQDVIASILKEEPPTISVEVPDRLRWTVEKALRKDREERYQTIREMFSDLRDLQRQEAVRKEGSGHSVLPESGSPSGQPAWGGGSDHGTAGISAESTTKEGDVALTADLARPTRSSAEYIAGAVGQHKRAAALLLVTLLLAIAGAAYFFYFARSGRAGINSVAVLPFVNASNDPNAEYLSDGISESLINSLSQLSQLKVIARSSSFKYKGKEFDPQEVAKALDVQAIVSGRVTERGDSLQISVELVNALDRTQMWGEQYNRRTSDLLAVQEEIARTITEKLRSRLTGGQGKQLRKPQTHNLEAYQLYLHGLFSFHNGATEKGALQRALDYFNQAIVLDPHFALAFTRVADIYNVFAINGSDLEPKEAMLKAKAAVQKALELDDSLAEAHVTLAAIKTYEWDWSGAHLEAKRALELNPNLAESHTAYASALSQMGRFTEALEENKQAQALDPLGISIKVGEGGILLAARRYDEAIQALQNVVKLQPDHGTVHSWLGYTYAAKGMYRDAIAEYQESIKISGGSTGDSIYLGAAYAMSGKRNEALTILNKLKITKEYVSPGELASLYAALGDKEEALQTLERAYSAHDLQLQFLVSDPSYDPLRSDPRFTDLMRRVGLPQ
jgi:eukaryotic-like serine/threonine-protein kinase